MKLRLEDDSIVDVPDGLSNDEIVQYVETRVKKPTLTERITGNLAMGVSDMAKTAGNILPMLGVEDWKARQTQAEFANMPSAQKVEAQPAQTLVGRLAEGLVRFIPEIPLYATGEGIAMAGMKAVPKLAPLARAISAVKGEGIVKGTARAVARASLGGAVVGTAGAEPGSDLLERMQSGGTEALEFAGAVGVLHPAMKVLGMASKGLVRRLRQPKTPEELKVRLERLAAKDAEAATMLDEMNKADTQKAADTTQVAAVDSETPFDHNMMEGRLTELGYKAEDIAGQTPETLKLIVEQGIHKQEVAPAEDVPDTIGRKRRRIARGKEYQYAPEDTTIQTPSESVSAQEAQGIAAPPPVVERTAANVNSVLEKKVAADRDFLKSTGYTEETLSKMDGYGIQRAAFDLRDKGVEMSPQQEVATTEALKKLEAARDAIDDSYDPFSDKVDPVTEANEAVLKDVLDAAEKLDDPEVGLDLQGIKMSAEKYSEMFDKLERIIEARNAKVGATPAQATVAPSKGAERRARGKVELAQPEKAPTTAEDWEAKLAAEGMPSELGRRAKRKQKQFTLDMFGGQQLYEKAVEKITKLRNISRTKLKYPPRSNVPVHGTDIDMLDGILSKGLKPGSAIDTTSDKSWIAEYPVMVKVPDAEKGALVAHNNYYKTLNTAKASEVFIDLEQYTDRTQGQVLDKIANLASKYPNVKFTILNESGPYKPRYTADDVIRLNEQLTEVYKERNPRLDEIKSEKEALYAPYKTQAGIIRNLPTSVSKQIDELDFEYKAIEKEQSRKIKALESRVREAEKDLDYSEGFTTFDMLGFQQLYETLNSKLQASKADKASPGSQTLQKLGIELNDKSQREQKYIPYLREIFMTLMKATEKDPVANKVAYKLQLADHDMKWYAQKHMVAVRQALGHVPTEADQVAIKAIIEKGVTGTPAQMEAAKIVQAEQNAVLMRLRDFFRQQMRTNMPKDEYAAFCEILGGTPEDVVLQKYATRPVTINYKQKDGTTTQKTINRKWVDGEVVKSLVRDYQAIDKWGLDNFITHVELGNLVIRVGDNIVARAMNREDAIRKIAQIAESNPSLKKVELDVAGYANDLKSSISKGQYYSIINKLSKALKDEVDGISSGVAKRVATKGVNRNFVIEPTHVFSPYTMPREEVLKGEENIFNILPHYFYSVEKKMAFDPVIDLFRSTHGKMNPEMARTVLQGIVDAKGKYWLEDKIADGFTKWFADTKIGRRVGADESMMGATRAVNIARTAEAWLKMGYRPVAGAVNWASGVGHIWTKVGYEYLMKGIQFAKSAEGAAFEAKVEPYIGTTFVEGATGIKSRNIFDKFNWEPKSKAGEVAKTALDPLGVFNLPEIPNRRIALAANYLWGKEKLGLSEDAAVEHAIRSNWAQEFIYNIANAPRIMRSPTGRLLGQFKSYLVQELEFISNLRGVEWLRYLGMQAALAGPRGYIMTLRTLPILGAITGVQEAFDLAEQWMNAKMPRASRGVGGALGVDVSGPASFQLPADVMDWVGPMVSDMANLWKSVVDPILSGEMPDGKKMTQSFPIMRHWSRLIDQVVDNDGWVKDERGRRLWQIDNSLTFAVKSLAGAEDIHLSEIRTANRILANQSKKYAADRMQAIDKILERVSKGETLDGFNEDVTLYNITPSSLRRAARYRVLDPVQRRLLSTELSRRPEILEAFPNDLLPSQR